MELVEVFVKGSGKTKFHYEATIERQLKGGYIEGYITIPPKLRNRNYIVQISTVTASSTGTDDNPSCHPTLIQVVRLYPSKKFRKLTPSSWQVQLKVENGKITLIREPAGEEEFEINSECLTENGSKLEFGYKNSKVMFGLLIIRPILETNHRGDRVHIEQIIRNRMPNCDKDEIEEIKNRFRGASNNANFNNLRLMVKLMDIESLELFELKPSRTISNNNNNEMEIINCSHERICSQGKQNSSLILSKKLSSLSNIGEDNKLVPILVLVQKSNSQMWKHVKDYIPDFVQIPENSVKILGQIAVIFDIPSQTESTIHELEGLAINDYQLKLCLIRNDELSINQLDFKYIWHGSQCKLCDFNELESMFDNQPELSLRNFLSPNNEDQQQLINSMDLDFNLFMDLPDISIDGQKPKSNFVGISHLNINMTIQSQRKVEKN